MLKEAAASLVARLVPEVTAAQWQAAIRSLAREFNREGMTGLKDPGIGPEVWDAYQKVLAEGALGVRVFVLWHAGASLDETREQIVFGHGETLGGGRCPGSISAPMWGGGKGACAGRSRVLLCACTISESI